VSASAVASGQMTNNIALAMRVFIGLTSGLIGWSRAFRGDYRGDVGIITKGD
jgi:hypothetical protein